MDINKPIEEAADLVGFVLSIEVDFKMGGNITPLQKMVFGKWFVGEDLTLSRLADELPVDLAFHVVGNHVEEMIKFFTDGETMVLPIRSGDLAMTMRCQKYRTNSAVITLCDAAASS